MQRESRTPGFLKRTAIAAGLAVAASPSMAQLVLEEIIVTASRVPQEGLSVGSAVDVLNEDDIKVRQQAFMSDLLRDLPGLAVNQSGPAGASFSTCRLFSETKSPGSTRTSS